ncbi:NAD/NADP octopine/nopaline dehydrogenase family protein [Intestinibacillus massiliensis]
MKIAVLGTGNGGTAMAADLKRKGHHVSLLKTSDIPSVHYDTIVSRHGEVIISDGSDQIHVMLDCVTNKFEQALTKDTELVVIFIQTNYHQELIKKIKPFLRDGQIVLLEPGYLSTLYFQQECPEIELIIVEAESSPLDCRIVAPGEVSILFRNIRNPVAVYPKSCSDRTLTRLLSLQYHFVLLHSVIEAALQNPNLIVHTIGAIMSIPRIEYTRGQYWMYKEVFTDSVWNLVLQLDKEKIAVLKKLGLPGVPYIDACKFRNSAELTQDSKTVFDNYAMNSSAKGPSISDSRYITEDVPEGLVLLESIGIMIGVETPICTSLINISNACLKKDFRDEGRTVERLGRNNFCATVLEQRIRTVPLAT